MKSSRVLIDSERAGREFGLKEHHEQMPNGEFRFRLKHTSGNGYILTIAGENGGWQRSHSHRSATEVYVVEAGWMAFASKKCGSSPASIEVHKEGDIVHVRPRLPHNVYLPKGARIHTVKIGAKTPSDWVSEPELDEELCEIPVDDLNSG